MRISIILLFFLFISCNSEKKPEHNPQLVSPDIHKILDDWHRAAAEADEESFFGAMSEDCIYLGTDKSERWLRDELRTWSKSFFEREKAWDFTPYNRELYFAEDGKTVWFEELLETWMGPCRGSGVLQIREGKWLLVHYNLAMLIDNDDVQDVIKIIQAPDEPLDVPQDSL